jgi:predicted GNAT family acetyltransferase
MDIQHDAENQLFYISLDTGRAILRYQKENDTLDLQSTYVPPASRNQGLAARLTHHALQYAQQQGYQVRPTCPYIQTYMERNPEFNELLEE